MRVLLTGAGGFIGAHVARQMVADRCDVHALVRPNSDTWRLAEIADRLNVLECDLSNEEHVGRCLEKVRPECCVHLAWYVEAGKFWHSLENLRSLQASLYLAMRLAELGCKRFVGTGTCAEYRSAPDALREDSPTEPNSLYVASKTAFSLALEQLGAATGMAVAWARIFHLYGPMEDERRLVPAVILSLLRNQNVDLTKGEPIRDFLHVEDVASAIWEIAKSDVTGPVNVGSGKPVAVRDVAATVGRILDRSDSLNFGALPYRMPEPPAIVADNSLLLGHTAWRPHFTLEDGLRQTIDWWHVRRGH